MFQTLEDLHRRILPEGLGWSGCRNASPACNHDHMCHCSRLLLSKCQTKPALNNKNYIHQIIKCLFKTTFQPLVSKRPQHWRGETYFDMVCTSPLVPCHSAPVVRQEFESAFSSSSQEPLPLYFHLAHRRARRRDSILYICRWLQALHMISINITIRISLLQLYFDNCRFRQELQ